MTNSALVLAGAGLRSRRRLGLLATFGVLAIAAIALAAGLVVSREGAPLLDAAADDANVAHLVLVGDADVIASVAADPEVVAWSGPWRTVDGVELPVGGELVPMQLTALDSPEIEVNSPGVESGRWAVDADEVVLDRSVGDDLGIALGETITLRREGTEATFDVVGTGVNFTDCFYPQCEPGRAWATEEGLDRLAAGGATFAQGWLRFDDPAQADPFVERLAATGVEGITGTESWLDTREDFLTLDRVFGSFVAAFGVFVLVVAAVVVAGSTAMRIVAQRRQIGLLGAIGSTPRQITAALLFENLVIGAIAGVLGWFVAGFLAASLQLGIGRTLGPQDPSWSIFGLVIVVATFSLILSVATVVPAVNAARRPVTDVLRDVPRDRVSWLNRRAGRLPRRMPLLGAQEAASQPTRGVLAALAIAIAIVGTLVSLGFIGGIDRVAADPAVAGDPWDVTLIPGDGSPVGVAQVLASTPGVEGWFSEVERRSTFQEGAFLSVAIGGDPAAADYRVVEGRSIRAAGEAIAGYGFLDRFGVAVGDEIELLAGTTPVDVTIVGWYRDTEDSGEILRYRIETLIAAEPGVVPTVYRIVAADGTGATELASSLTEQLGPTARTEILDTGVDDMAPLFNVLRLVALVLLVTAGVNLLSTLLTSNREAAGRVGVQLAVGFAPRQIITQGAVAGAVLGLVATIVGVPLGLWIFRALSDVVSTSLGVGPGWMPAPAAGHVAAVAVAAVIVAAALGALAVTRIASRPASDLVRGE